MRYRVADQSAARKGCAGRERADSCVRVSVLHDDARRWREGVGGGRETRAEGYCGVGGRGVVARGTTQKDNATRSTDGFVRWLAAFCRA